MKWGLPLSFCLILTVIARGQAPSGAATGAKASQMAQREEQAKYGLSPAGKKVVRWRDPGHEIAVAALQRAQRR